MFLQGRLLLISGEGIESDQIYLQTALLPYELKPVNDSGIIKPSITTFGTGTCLPLPNLLTIKHEGRSRDVIAQISKSGFIFVLDRDTGEPIFPILETPFPASDLDGEMAWPTQPVPSKPSAFVRQVLHENDIHSTDSATYDSLVSVLGKMRAGGQFIPASLEGTVLFPGFSGGGEWGGASANPNLGIMYVNANEWPSILRMEEPLQLNGQEHTVNNIGKIIYQLNCGVCHGDDRQEQPNSTYPSLENLNERLNQNEIMHLINNGKGLMPSFQHLDSLKKEALGCLFIE